MVYVEPSDEEVLREFEEPEVPGDPQEAQSKPSISFLFSKRERTMTFVGDPEEFGGKQYVFVLQVESCLCSMRSLYGCFYQLNNVKKNGWQVVITLVSGHETKHDHVIISEAITLHLSQQQQKEKPTIL